MRSDGRSARVHRAIARGSWLWQSAHVTPPIRFRGRVEYWDPEAGKGLAVMLIPDEFVAQLGGLRQFRVRGTINGREFTSSAMVRRPRRLCVSLSKAVLAAADLQIGSEAEVTLEREQGSGSLA